MCQKLLLLQVCHLRKCIYYSRVLVFKFCTKILCAYSGLSAIII